MSKNRTSYVSSAQNLVAAVTAVIGSIALGIVGAGAQTSATVPAAPRFEVASVKPSAAAQFGQPSAVVERNFAGVAGRVDLRHIALTNLLMRVFELQPERIIRPKWLDSEYFDISATMRARASREQVALMFQDLLAERFNLKFHFETPMTKVYALVAEEAGTKLRKGLPDDAADGNFGAIERTASGAGENRSTSTTIRASFGTYKLTSANGVVHYEFQNITMKALAYYLSNRWLSLPVVDMTLLEGPYQVRLDIPVSELEALHGPASGPSMDQDGSGQLMPEAPEPAGSSIRTSLEEQGLKLVPRNAPLERLVIDHIERTPTPN